MLTHEIRKKRKQDMNYLKHLGILSIIMLTCLSFVNAQDNRSTITQDNVENLQVIGDLGTGNRHIALSHNDEFAAVLSIIPATDNTEREDHIIIWDLNNLTPIADFFFPEFLIETFNFYIDSDYLIVGSVTGEIIIWDRIQEEIITSWLAHWSNVTVIELNPDNPNLLVTASSRISGTSPANNLILWDISDLATPEELSRYQSEFGSNINSAVFYDNDTVLMSIGLQLHIWHIETENVQIITGHTSFIEDMVWLPNVQGLLTVGDSRLIEWQTNTMFDQLPIQYRAVIGDPMFFENPYAIYSVDVSADGQIIITGDSNGEIKFWDTDTLELLRTIPAHDEPIAQVRFNEAGDTLITISQTTEDVKLWRIVDKLD
jgi:WD40 repeat protein